MEVARLVLAMVLGMALPLALQLLDRRRLDPGARARSWNLATWGSAIYAFGPLSMLGWCWVTRPRWRRVWVGGISTGLLVACLELADCLFGRATGRPSAELDDVAVALAFACAAGTALLTVFELVVAVRRRMH